MVSHFLVQFNPVSKWELGGLLSVPSSQLSSRGMLVTTSIENTAMKVQRIYKS